MNKILTLFIITSCVMCHPLPAQIDGVANLPVSPRTSLSTDPATGVKIKEMYFVVRADTSLRHGQYKAYTTKGSELMQGAFNRDKKHGKWKYWYTDGAKALKSEGTFTNGTKTGTWKYYYNTSPPAIKQEIEYSLYESTIDVKNYYQNGQMESAGKKDRIQNVYYHTGSWTYWYSSGVMKEQGRYALTTNTSRNKRGTWKYWHPNGQLKAIEQYNSGGIIHGQRKEFNSSGEPEKIETYKHGKLIETFDRFSNQQQTIDSLYKTLDVYKSDFPAVYDNEIEEIGLKIKEYKQADKTTALYEKGSEIVSQLKNVDSTYEILSKQSEKIQNLFQKVKEKYSTHEKLLYKVEISPLSKELEVYRNKKYIRPKLAFGHELSKKLSEYLELYQDIEYHVNSVNDKLVILEIAFQGNYPELIDTEIKPVKDRENALKEINNARKKFAESKNLLEELTRLEEKSIKLKGISAKMTDLLPVLEEYEETYPNIYERYVPEITTRRKEFKNSVSIDEKISVGKDLVVYLEEFHDKFYKIEAMKYEIGKRELRLDSEYKEADQYKNIYKNLKDVFDDYSKTYEDIEVIDSKLQKGRELCEIIDKALEIDPQKKNQLEKQLENVKSEKEVVRILKEEY